MGSSVEFICDQRRLRPSGSEVFRLLGCPKKLHQLSDYSPQVSLREGLQKTIDWFSRDENLTRYKTHLYNV